MKKYIVESNKEIEDKWRDLRDVDTQKLYFSLLTMPAILCCPGNVVTEDQIQEWRKEGIRALAILANLREEILSLSKETLAYISSQPEVEDIANTIRTMSL